MKRREAQTHQAQSFRGQQAASYAERHNQHLLKSARQASCLGASDLLCVTHTLYICGTGQHGRVNLCRKVVRARADKGQGQGYCARGVLM